MLKKKTKIRKQLARIVLAALLCSGGLHGLAAPPVAEAATTITVSNITGDEPTRKLTVTADPKDSVAGHYSDSMECFVVYPVPQPDGIDEVKITGSALPAGFYGAHYDVEYTDVHRVAVSGANTVLGHVYTNVQNMEGAAANHNTLIVEDATVQGVSSFGAKAVAGFSEAGDATGNRVEIRNAKIGSEESYKGNVCAGVTASGSAADNSVTVKGDATRIYGLIYGGLSYDGNATGNQVTISGGTVGAEGAQDGRVVGGYASKTASGNTVTITGGTVGKLDEEEFPIGEVFGGYSENGAASSNTVNIDGGSVTGVVQGGYGESGTASSNTVNINGGSVTGIVVGGGSESGTASSNTVNIKGGSVTDNVIGGGSESGAAVNNTVNILVPLQIKGLFGGICDAAASVGNTLNIAAKNVVTGEAGWFQNMNFYLPADIANGDTMLTVNGSEPADVKGVTFGVAAQKGANLAVGDTVNLVVGEQGLVTDDTLKTASGAALGKAEFLAMNNMSTDDQYGLSISKLDANTIIATVDSKTPMNNENRHKSPAETRESVVTLVNTGADLLAGVGMQNAADAAAAEQAGKDGAAAPGTGGYAPFAAMGVSSLRAQSGSHVDTKGIGLALGFARELQNKSGKLLVGPLLEYGYGRYDSYQDDNSNADGKSHYWGVGIIAKQTNDSGLYYEGSLRIGRARSDYNRNNPPPSMSYDSEATYFGAHLGIGKVQDIGHDNTLDYYGKYFYSHTGSDSVLINGVGITAVFDGVDSHRLRVGARLTHAVNEKNKIYGGLAYQYEFNGDARVTYSGGGNAPSPSVKGGSGMLELGWQVKPGRSPMVIDLGVTGWVGKQRGITANLQANWTF